MNIHEKPPPHIFSVFFFQPSHLTPSWCCFYVRHNQKRYQQADSSHRRELKTEKPYGYVLVETFVFHVLSEETVGSVWTCSTITSFRWSAKITDNRVDTNISLETTTTTTTTRTTTNTGSIRPLPNCSFCYISSPAAAVLCLLIAYCCLHTSNICIMSTNKRVHKRKKNN